MHKELDKANTMASRASEKVLTYKDIQAKVLKAEVTFIHQRLDDQKKIDEEEEESSLKSKRHINA